jgi:hypothetical protein
MVLSAAFAAIAALCVLMFVGLYHLGSPLANPIVTESATALSKL